MTDDFDRLTAALKAAPAPEPQAKEAALRLAMENFDRLQASAPEVRPSHDRPQRAGILTGVRQMLNRLTSRPLLAATTSAAALGLGLVVILPQMQAPTGPALPPAPEPVLMAEPAAEPPAPAKPAPAARAKAAAPEAAPMADVASEAPLADAAGIATAAPEAVVGMAAPEAVVGMAAPEPGLLLQTPDTEAFAHADPNPVKVTAEQPVSTFSADVDTASWSIVRSSLNAGQLPPKEAVRIEEMVNYFPYAYPAPEPGGAPFRPSVTVMPTPWNADTRLVVIGLQGALPAIADRPPLNLVFLIDTSGSMDEPSKLPLLKQSLRLMLPGLHPEDQVAIVAYAGSAGTVLPPTPASDRAAISEALDRLSAGGSTAGAEGLALAYQEAAKMAAPGEVSRVILATDGDFNVGLSDPEALKDFIARERDSGTYLSVLGFGRGNLDDATMQALAQTGNGTAAYIDTANEARKVLVDQLTGALFPIADDVKFQVEWNPAEVAEYRLIGYETRALNREDFNNDKVDAGEIGAGLQVTALYEIAAPGSPGLKNDPLRYGTEPVPMTTDELGFLRLRWKAPGAAESQLIEQPILPTATPPTEDARFAAAVAGMGQLLTGGTYLGDWGWDQAIALAEGAKGEDPYGYRAEAVSLMRMAQALER